MVTLSSLLYKSKTEEVLQVTGELLDNLTSWDVLRAALPVGTVSGAPKVLQSPLVLSYNYACLSVS